MIHLILEILLFAVVLFTVQLCLSDIRWFKGKMPMKSTRIQVLALLVSVVLLALFAYIESATMSREEVHTAPSIIRGVRSVFRLIFG